jgi:hypothetical protein
MGSDPIVFVGQDLGFSDGLCYAPGTSYDDVWRPETGRFCTVEMKQWEQIARERFILRRIPDYQGRPMYTEERLFTYLQQFERDFAKSKATIIDATEGGAAKRGARVMTLEEAVEKYCRSGVSDLKSQIAEPPTPGLPPECRREGVGGIADCLGRRADEAARIEQICRDTLPLLEEIRDHGDNPAWVNRAIVAVDALRARMNELGATYDLVTQLTQSSELERFKADRCISAAKEMDGAKRQRRQVNRDIENVRAVQRAAHDFQDLMRTTIDELEHRRRRHFSDGVGPVEMKDAA